MPNTYYIRARIAGTADFCVHADSEEDAIQAIEWGEQDPEDQSIDEYMDCEVMDVEYGETTIYVNVTVEVAGAGDKESLLVGAENRVDAILAGNVAADRGTYITPESFRLEGFEINEANIES